MNLDEVLINTITHSHQARLRSYTLLADAMGINTVAPIAASTLEPAHAF